jgi:transcriptional antiterminator NusG
VVTAVAETLTKRARKADAVDLSDAPLPPFLAPSCDWQGLDWYALQTNIRCEAKASAGLRAKGIEVFAPVQRRWVRHRRTGLLARKWRQTERPLFVRYIFVGFERGRHDWFEVRRTDGVEKVVTVEGVPIKIPPRKIVEVFDLVMSGEFDEDDRPRRRRNDLKRGSRVMVNDARLGEVEAVVMRDPKPTAERVLLELLSSGAKIIAPVESVKAVVDA